MSVAIERTTTHSFARAGQAIVDLIVGPPHAHARVLEKKAREVACGELLVFPNGAEVAFLVIIGDDDFDIGLAHEQLPQVRKVVVVDGRVEFLDMGAKEGRV